MGQTIGFCRLSPCNAHSTFESVGDMAISRAGRLAIGRGLPTRPTTESCQMRANNWLWALAVLASINTRAMRMVIRTDVREHSRMVSRGQFMGCLKEAITRMPGAPTDVGLVRLMRGQ